MPAPVRRVEGQAKVVDAQISELAQPPHDAAGAERLRAVLLPSGRLRRVHGVLTCTVCRGGILVAGNDSQKHVVALGAQVRPMTVEVALGDPEPEADGAVEGRPEAWVSDPKVRLFPKRAELEAHRSRSAAQPSPRRALRPNHDNFQRNFGLHKANFSFFELPQ